MEAYRGVLEAFPGKKVVVRTLDAGADKPLPFLTDSTEANPALGVRAYRTARRDPEVLEHQLQALAKAEAVTSAKVWVMAPMISTADEAKAFTDKARSYGLTIAGMMIEVPSAAIMADKLFEHAPGDLFIGMGMPMDKGLPEIVQAELYGFFRLVVARIGEMVQHY